jgi:L-gulonolactone oxidase
VVGSGHSFSPIALGNNYLISLSNVNKVISADPNSVTCQSGLVLKDLYTFLFANNLSLSNFGVINKQTVAGAIATGTHGSGIQHQSLSAEILKLKLILADGSILEINKNSEINGLNLWEAASLSLGLLGIVTEITLQVEPLFYLKSEEDVISFEDYIECMDRFANQYEYFKAWWFPHTDKVYLFKASRVGKDIYFNRKNEQKYSNEQRKREREMDSLTSPMFIASNVSPEKIPEINQYCLDYYFTPRKRIGTSFDILIHDETVPMIVSEYTLPLTKGIHKQALIALHNKMETSNIKLHFPVDLRYTASESTWLSPAYNSESFHIGLCVREYYKQCIPKQMKLFFETMNRYNARPHWGKLFDLSGTQLNNLYPRLQDFKKVKRMLDPCNIFSNEHLDQWFAND